MRTTRLARAIAHGGLLHEFGSAFLETSITSGAVAFSGALNLKHQRRPQHCRTRDGHHPSRRRRRPPHHASASASSFPLPSAARPKDVSVLQLPVLDASDVAVVWFTSSDLRIHDHDGLVAAAGAAGVVPLYVFDDEELALDSPLDATFAYHAVSNLRRNLRRIGSDLIVRSGDVSEELRQIVEQVGASHVFFHSSPVHALRQSHERAKAALSSGDKRSPVHVHSWSSAQLTGLEERDPSRAWKFGDFERDIVRQPARAAFAAPDSLPPLPAGVSIGACPTLDEILSRVGSQGSDKARAALTQASRDEAPFGTSEICKDGYGESWALRVLDDYLSMSDVDFARSIFGPENGDARYPETGLEAAATRRIVKARGYKGLAPGEAFARAIGVALALGCISPRRMFLARRPDYKPSYVHETGGEAGDGLWMPRRRRLPGGKCWARELAVIESWHTMLANRDIIPGNDRGGVMQQRYLRWNGWLVRYAVGGSEDPTDPTVLLVHGFGASSDQWDRVFEEFAPGRNSRREGREDVGIAGGGRAPSSQQRQGGAGGPGLKLLALDLVGFGHSAKPPLSFSQYSWADCARDVALRAGGGPFFIAGNSIGGYISMGVAADCRKLCEGVVLVNSAGRILTPKEFQTERQLKYGGLTVEEATREGKLGAYSVPPNTALAVLGAGLFAFLQGRISKICRNVYPVNPDIVDEGLAEDILRDSCDPGAVGVIAAGGKLPFSRSANEMLGKFGGPVLVTQGVKDPLNDAEGRATSFQALGSQVDVVRLNGGHCPHHEIAGEVCAAISSFVERVSEERSSAVVEPAGAKR